jgi:hypothetical protein
LKQVRVQDYSSECQPRCAQGFVLGLNFSSKRAVNADFLMLVVVQMPRFRAQAAIGCSSGPGTLALARC